MAFSGIWRREKTQRSETVNSVAIIKITKRAVRSVIQIDCCIDEGNVFLQYMPYDGSNCEDLLIEGNTFEDVFAGWKSQHDGRKNIQTNHGEK